MKKKQKKSKDEEMTVTWQILFKDNKKCSLYCNENNE